MRSDAFRSFSVRHSTRVAAITLFNQASNCPSFGGGFKGSLRGGAPITTLVFGNSRGGKLVTATFEGVLHVRDPDRLAALLENGIGPAKAFGCGLLLVRRFG